MQNATGITTDLDENDLSRIPSGMDTDPTADEEVIDQRAGNEHYPKAVEEPGFQKGDNLAEISLGNEHYPKAVEEPGPARIVPDDLSDSIAYAIDGSGPGPANDA